ncbi:DEKNAAC105095 [Brettanomyces naardenensis]|uniref:D-lactate dehydrogenase (cytochrome) n=1 Tax=Brettanomyces naardenensis TaxID=13370 RepID=A0A448YSQ9_BRENA|nr:DEKNAAC105095 [Brettanomyces naardenensis]
MFPALRTCGRSTNNSVKLGFRFVSSSSPKPKPKPKPSSSFSRSAGLFFVGALAGAIFVSYRTAENPPSFLFPPSSTTKLLELTPPKYGKPGPAIKEIRQKLGEDKVIESQNTLDDHSDTYFQTEHATEDQRPVAVVYPESTEEVSEIMKICHEHRVPVVPFTGGTSLEGHFTPTRKGICVDLSRMNRIISLHKDDLDVVVQPAVGWEELKDYLDEYHLLFGPDPGPGACIGGMVGTSCSGTNAARWGTMKENVISLTVVLADGTIIRTKKRPRKSSAGYNLNGLFIGSEGTLGIVTEATLKLNVKPKFENIAVVSFPTIGDAANSVSKFVQEGLQLDAMELLDEHMLHFVNDSGETTLKYDELPTLMLKIGGNSKEGLNSTVKSVEQICMTNHNESFRFAETDEEKYELWNARKVALWSTISYGQNHIGKDVQLWTTDVAVPISELGDSLEVTKKDLEETGLPSSIVGHVGDGNYHCFLLFKKEDRGKAEAAVERMVARAIEAEGTVTGEHGIGVGKREYLQQEVGEDVIALMRKIKMAIDPYRILNPDKVFRVDPGDDIAANLLAATKGK